VEDITLAVHLDTELCPLLENGLLRVETVDGAQGAEADYVILSMVRCRPRCGIGFLNKPNRLCVAFSRAKRLLLIIGHTETFEKSGNILIQSLLGVCSPSLSCFIFLCTGVGDCVVVCNMLATKKAFQITTLATFHNKL
jgi:hypothetical protein